jgi:hypothetical protein
LDSNSIELLVEFSFTHRSLVAILILLFLNFKFTSSEGFVDLIKLLFPLDFLILSLGKLLVHEKELLL